MSNVHKEIYVHEIGGELVKAYEHYISARSAMDRLGGSLIPVVLRTYRRRKNAKNREG